MSNFKKIPYTRPPAVLARGWSARRRSAVSSWRVPYCAGPRQLGGRVAMVWRETGAICARRMAWLRAARRADRLVALDVAAGPGGRRQAGPDRKLTAVAELAVELTAYVQAQPDCRFREAAIETSSEGNHPSMGSSTGVSVVGAL